MVDESVTVTFYRDGDLDGVGVGSMSIEACPPAPAGYSSIAGDCDDTESSVRPGASAALLDQRSLGSA
jgi:hypothetical protein